MGEDPGTGRSPLTASQPEQIERDIVRTREELGDTVEALARKTDVKAQAKQKVKETKASLSARSEQLFAKAKDASPEGTSEAAGKLSRTTRDNPLPLAAAAAFASGFLAGRITKRR